MPAGHRDIVASHNPYAIDRLTHVLSRAVESLAETFHPRFERLRRREFGAAAGTVAEALFRQWCEQSGIAPPDVAIRVLVEGSTQGEGAPELRRRVRADLGFNNAEAAATADRYLAQLQQGDDANRAAGRVVWDLYAPLREPFFTQTAHLVLARVLLYRIGEDTQIFPERLSGDSLAKRLEDSAKGLIGSGEAPSLGAVMVAVGELETFLPVVYKPGTFDWWVIDDAHQRSLTEAQLARLREADRELDRVWERILQNLDDFSFQGVDVDVWREVYQRYLPPEERQRLGGFYTPEDVVDLMLDLAGYQVDAEGLCAVDLLDFSSGSGTFPFQASARLLQHLDARMGCHSDVHAARATPWQIAERKLKILEARLHAVDIHVFAAFLTTLNLLFRALPLLLESRRHNPNTSYDPQVFAHDALGKPADLARDARLWEEANSRVALSEDSMERFKDVSRKSFDLVIGNPPWGGVLKGRLSPLFNPELKAAYKQEYPDVATGKFNIYSLFFQRGLEWLRRGGRLAIITENKYLGHDFGAGVRSYLSRESSVTHLIDLEPFGPLFFDAMNTPCISIAIRGASPGPVAVVKVRPPRGGVPGTSQRAKIGWVIDQVRTSLAQLFSEARRRGRKRIRARAKK